MTTESWIIINPDIKSRALSKIAGLIMDGTKEVTIRDAKSTRSDKQLRLKWMWMNHLETVRSGSEGYTAEHWNNRMKYLFMKPLILEQDEDWADHFRWYDEMSIYAKAAGQLAEKKFHYEFWDKIPSSTLNVRNMALWMAKIDKYCVKKLQVTLPVPDDLMGWNYE